MNFQIDFSIGMLSDMYVQNHKKFKDYYKALDAGKLHTWRGIILNTEDQLRRDVITRLMCHFQLDKRIIEKKYQIDFDRHFENALGKLKLFQFDGLINLNPDRIEVTDQGRLLIRNIAMCFDAYLDTQSENKPLFSKTV